MDVHLDKIILKNCYEESAQFVLVNDAYGNDASAVERDFVEILDHIILHAKR